MANYCQYRIRVKSPNKNIARLVFESQPFMDYREQCGEKQLNDGYWMEYIGDCAWGVDYLCETNEDFKIEPKNLKDEIYFRETADKLMKMPMKQKSKILNSEINVLQWSGESEFCDFFIVKDGETTNIPVSPFYGDNDIPVYISPGKEFSCREGEYEYDKEDYDSFREFKEDEDLPTSITLSKHFIKEDDGVYYIKAIGPQYGEEPKCDVWSI